MFNITEWFNNEFWPTYNAKYCGGGSRKGPKSKALVSAKKKIQSQEKATEVLLALREQLRFHKHELESKDWVPNFPMCVTWLNQERWTTEIDSFTEMGEPLNLGSFVSLTEITR